MKRRVLSRCHDAAAGFIAITKSSHTTSVLCFFHYHVMYQKHRFYTRELLHSKVSQRFIISQAHSRSCHANETCVATLIFLKQVTKAQPSPHVGEPGVQFLSCHSWLILNSASDDRDPHLTDHNTPSPSNTGKKCGHL